MLIEARNMHLLDKPGTAAQAVCDVSLGDQFLIEGVRVVAGKDGKPFVSLPSYKDKAGDYHEVAHPVTKEAREALTKTVLGEFERLVVSRVNEAVNQR